MSTPNNAPNDEIQTNESLPGEGARSETAGLSRVGATSLPSNPTTDSWMGTASFIFAGISGVGFLLVLFGAYLTPNDLLILIGAGIMTMAAVGWVIVAVMMIGSIIRRWWFDIFGKANKGMPPTRLE